MDEVAQPKIIRHLVGGHHVPMSVLDSMEVSVRFLGVEGLPTYELQCMRYRLGDEFVTGEPYAGPPRAWVRAVGTEGWRDTSTYDRSYEVPFGRITLVSPSRVKAETFVYRVPGYGWYPVEPAEARIAVTVIGEPQTVGVGDGQGSLMLGVRVLPNPIVRSALFQLTVPAPSRLKAEIIDVTGRRVATLADGHFLAGEHELQWDGRGSDGARSPAGVYFLRLHSGSEEITKRLVLMAGRP
jgi:hypothetical protein